MAIIKKTTPKKQVIDLTGPQGNAFFLLAMVWEYGKQLEMNPSEMNAIEKDMQSGDYEHLISVFDEHFGDYVDLER